MAGSKSYAAGIGEGGDFQATFEALTYGKTTRVNKTLPPATPAPSIPARVGSSPPIAAPTSATGISGFVLRGPVVVTSSDGIFTISYPQSVETVVDGVTLKIPAISKTP